MYMNTVHFIFHSSFHTSTQPHNCDLLLVTLHVHAHLHIISKAVICFQCLLWQYDDITEERLVSESQRLKVFREAVLRTAASHRCSEQHSFDSATCSC